MSPSGERASACVRADAMPTRERSSGRERRGYGRAPVGPVAKKISAGVRIVLPVAL